jgi:hypothetical protein
MRTAAFVLVLCAGTAAPAQEKKGAVDQAKVDAAVAKGTSYLKTLTANLGRGGNREMAELVLLAMAHGGVPPTDPSFAPLLGQVLEMELTSTYRVSLQAMLLEEVDRVKHQARIHQCAQFLVDNQDSDGLWGYGQPTRYPQVVPVPTGNVPTGDDRPRVVIFADPEPGQKPPVRQKIPVKQNRVMDRGTDNSNSQYAMLGLRACHDAGIVLPKEVVQRAAKWWSDAQCGDGGWSYHGKGNAYGSMTAGAIGALAICDYILGKDWKTNGDLRKGADWLAANFTVAENPRLARSHHYYYLYALERAGILYDVVKFGSHDWYAEGAKLLLAQQQPNGAWNGGPYDTCFAILFLKRATRSMVESRSAK